MGRAGRVTVTILGVRKGRPIRADGRGCVPRYLEGDRRVIE